MSSPYRREETDKRYQSKSYNGPSALSAGEDRKPRNAHKTLDVISISSLSSPSSGFMKTPSAESSPSTASKHDHAASHSNSAASTSRNKFQLSMKQSMSSADNEWAVESPPLRTPNHELQSQAGQNLVGAIDHISKTSHSEDAGTHGTKSKHPFARNAGVRTDAAPSPLVERVNTKLTGWSWDMEKAQEEDGETSLPLYSQRHTVGQGKSRTLSGNLDVPSPPPNTQYHSRQSSGRHSIPQSVDAEEERTSDKDAGTPEDFGSDHEDEDEEKDDNELDASMAELEQSTDLEPEMIDLKSQARRSGRPGIGPPRSSCPAFASASRQFSNLTAEETHFQAHRNSVDLARERKHMQDLAGKLNQSLMNVQDSFVVTKSKLGARAPTTSPSSSSNLVRLEQHHSSPEREPSMRVQNLSAFLAMNSSAAAKLDEPPKPVQYSSEEHDGCPICETDRPDWMRSKHKKRYMDGE